MVIVHMKRERVHSLPTEGGYLFTVWEHFVGSLVESPTLNNRQHICTIAILNTSTAKLGTKPNCTNVTGGEGRRRDKMGQGKRRDRGGWDDGKEIWKSNHCNSA